MDAKYPCPACGFLVFDEIDTYKFCPVCDWMDELSALRFATDASAHGKGVSLLEHQRRWVAEHPAPPKETVERFARDPTWRPIDLDVDEIEVPVDGVDYGMTYFNDPTAYYYWRH
jgi:Cysteine-rich CPCC